MSWRKKDMKFAGFTTAFAFKNLCPSEIHKATQATIWWNRRPLIKRLRKVMRHFYFTLSYWAFKQWKFNKIRRTCAKRFWNNQEQQNLCTCHSGSTSRGSTWRIIMISYLCFYLASKNSAEFSRWRTMDQNVSWKLNQKRAKHHQQKKVDSTAIRRGKPQGTNQKIKRHCKWDRWETF